MRNITFKVLYGIISILIAQFLCYFLIDDIFVNFATSILTFVSLRLVLAITVYISINWVMDKVICKLEKDILFFSYILLSVSISLLRFNLDMNRYPNFNVINIINYSKTTIFFNIFFYIPFGVYFSNRINISKLYKFIIFLSYILVIEISQHFLNVGFFDINDVILNCLGFLIGYILQRLIRIM